MEVIAELEHTWTGHEAPVYALERGMAAAIFFSGKRGCFFWFKTTFNFLKINDLPPFHFIGEAKMWLIFNEL